MRKILNSLEETKEFGKELAKSLSKDMDRVVLLRGEMGAGKTTLVSQIVRELGENTGATSPTFIIINQYCDNIYHVDLWRVNETEIGALGLCEILSGSNIVFIEWAEKLPAGYLESFNRSTVTIQIQNLGENKRQVTAHGIYDRSGRC